MSDECETIRAALPDPDLLSLAKRGIRTVEYADSGAIARAALAGGTPPQDTTQTEAGDGASAVVAEDGEPSGGSAWRYQLCPRCDGQEHDKGSCGLCQNTGILDHEGDAYFPPPGYDKGTRAEVVARLNHMVHASRYRYG